MSNESRYEKLRIEVRTLKALVYQIMAHVGLEPPAAPIAQFEEETRERPRFDSRGAGGSHSFGGGASMRNSPKVPRVPTGPKLQKIGVTVGNDGTRMTVRRVAPGTPRPRAPDATAAAPAAAPAPGQAAPAAAAALGGEAFQQLLSTAANIAEALGNALTQLGAAPPVEQSEQSDPGEVVETQGVEDPNAWMAAEGINPGETVATG